MEIEVMGRVVVKATVKNMSDVYDAENGRIRADQVRTVVVPDAIVDTGAKLLSLPRSMIRTLGLKRIRSLRTRTTAGVVMYSLYSLVQLEVDGRDCRIDVAEVPDGTPVLIGQMPLEHMDFVIDMSKHQLVGNPEHGGEWMLEQY